MNLNKKLIILLMITIKGFSADSEDWVEHDKLFKRCQKLMKADQYEQLIINVTEKDGKPPISKRELNKKKPEKEKCNIP